MILTDAQFEAFQKLRGKKGLSAAQMARNRVNIPGIIFGNWGVHKHITCFNPLMFSNFYDVTYQPTGETIVPYSCYLNFRQARLLAQLCSICFPVVTDKEAFRPFVVAYLNTLTD